MIDENVLLGIFLPVPMRDIFQNPDYEPNSKDPGNVSGIFTVFICQSVNTARLKKSYQNFFLYTHEITIDNIFR